jgi:hypothetical protein
MNKVVKKYPLRNEPRLASSWTLGKLSPLLTPSPLHSREVREFWPVSHGCPVETQGVTSLPRVQHLKPESLLELANSPGLPNKIGENAKSQTRERLAGAVNWNVQKVRYCLERLPVRNTLRTFFATVFSRVLTSNAANFRK